MNYVALLSGGKDSCFNLLHCHANGHNLIAAASLRPPEGIEELDSFLYQSVGQEVIQLIADALDVPLYRGTINGSAIQQSLQYGSNESVEVQGDETEDLYKLLLHVKQVHPEIQAVAVGAILSNYQRLRVENVCNRLGLVPLCYLWQRSQSELFSEMIASGLDAIILKVAGIGLSRKHVGKSLGDIRDYLFQLNALYGSHICGEGGEYESLTLDCPLFKKRLRIDESEIVTHSDGAFASVYYLRVTKASLVDKPDNPATLPLEPPPLLCEEAREISAYSGLTSTNEPSLDVAGWDWNLGSVSSPIATENWLCLPNLALPQDRVVESAAEELDEVFSMAEDMLQQYELKFEHVLYVNLFLASMADFASINATYHKRFRVSPPARVTVEVILPPGRHVRLELIAYVPSQRRKKYSLHVQSLSYWAPANIGPYSQATSASSQIFVSGQIGLVPASNSIPTPTSSSMEAALALQHVQRIREVVREEFRTADLPQHQGIIAWASSGTAFANLLHIWKGQHSTNQAFQSFEVPTAFLLSSTLPKQAECEMQVFLHVPTMEKPDSDDEELSIKVSVSARLQTKENIQEKVVWEEAIYPETGSALTFAFFDRHTKPLNLAITGQSHSVRLYCSVSPIDGMKRIEQPNAISSSSATVVGVKTIADRSGRSWDYLAVFTRLPKI